MKDMKRAIASLCTATLLLGLMSGCGQKAAEAPAPTESQTPASTESQSPAPAESQAPAAAESQAPAETQGKYIPGTYEAVAEGLGKVTVTLTFDENSITDAKVDVSHETPNIGGALGTPLASTIMRSQSAEFDAITSATITSNAVITATADCIDQAMGIDTSLPADAVYFPGIYTMTEYANDKINVDVRFDAKNIISIKLTNHDGESDTAVAAADKLIEDMMAAQTYDVAVTEEETTCNAVRTCVQNAMAEARIKIKSAAVAADIQDNYDVVIVGGGMAGLMAAYKLEGEHPDVNYIVLEKTSMLGGAVPFSGGAISGLTSPMQEAEGTTYTTDDIVNLYQAASDTTDINSQLLANVYSGSGEILTTLVDAGAPFSYQILSASVYNDKVYTLWPMGLAYYGGRIQMGFLNRFFEDHDINVAMNTEVADLAVDGNKVTGVVLADGRTIHADAVLLATGGFGANREMCEELIPLWTKGEGEAGHGATGHGIIWTQKHFGSGLIGQGAMGRQYTVNMYDPLAFDSRFMVTVEGKRFINEESPKYAITRYIANETEEGYAFMIMDCESNPELISQRTAAGQIKPYDSLEELAEDNGINVENLLASVERFNGMVESGEDTDFGVDMSTSQKIDKAPYYVDVVHCNYFGTLPGLEVTDSMEVLNGDREPVEGLYAAGEVMIGNVLTRQYPGMGQGVSWAINSGIYAGESIAEALGK